MQNTIENKAKFFAQYWWQEVFVLKEQNYRITKSRFNAETFSQKPFISLKPLSSISDEDAIEVSTIWGSDVKSKITGGIIVSRILSADSSGEMRNVCGVIDFLRSRGYALPWMGVSVEQQIEWGWVKLSNA